MKPLRAALLGCGSFGHQHAGTLAANPDQVQLVAFYDRHPERAADYASKYAPNAAVFTDLDALFKETRLDLIVDVLPPYGHTHEVDLAAAHGVHIFIEKPIALTSDKAWRMVEVTEKAGVKTQVGFNLRFGTAAQRVKTLLNAGEAGQPGLALASYSCNSLHSHWWRKKELSGGQVFEQAIHLADLMRFFLGSASTVYSRQANLFHRDVPDYTVEDVSGTVFGFKNGAVGVLGATNGALPERWEYTFRLVCQFFTVDFIDANHATLTYTNTPGLKIENIASEDDIYALEMQDLFSAIEQDLTPLVPMREGAHTLDMVAAAMRSADTHHEERIVR